MSSGFPLCKEREGNNAGARYGLPAERVSEENKTESYMKTIKIKYNETAGHAKKRMHARRGTDKKARNSIKKCINNDTQRPKDSTA